MIHAPYGVNVIMYHELASLFYVKQGSVKAHDLVDSRSIQTDR